MIGLLGVVVVFAMVFGGYIAAGGKMGIILKSLPFEMTMIGGAAVGAFLISNSGADALHTIKDISRAFKGAKWKKQDYNDLLCLLYILVRTSKQNPMSLEANIENPKDSDIFNQYPRILADKNATEMICDTFRSASMNYDDPHQVEEVLEKRLEEMQQHDLHSSHALQTVADGLPALGIVAAVLGVIKTMGSIDQPPEVLGKLIGGALVGTFLGVFLAYGIVGPIAARLKSIVETDTHFYQLIREVLVSNLHDNTVGNSIEVGRQNTPSSLRPSFNDLEESLSSLSAGIS